MHFLKKHLTDGKKRGNITISRDKGVRSKDDLAPFLFLQENPKDFPQNKKLSGSAEKRKGCRKEEDWYEIERCRADSRETEKNREQIYGGNI